MNVSIRSLANQVNEIVTICGWMFNKRQSGKIIFLELRDGSGTIQAIVVKSDVSAEVFEAAEALTMESSLKVTGKVTAHPKEPETFEIQVKEIETVQLVTEDYPISKKEHGPEFLLDNRHLWLRSRKQWAIQIIRNTVIRAIYDYLDREGFVKIDAPILTPNACEGTTTLFEIDYFGVPAYLTQSGQLYLEAAIFSVGRCFDFGPVFRAESSKTRRHLNEFWMMDAEMPFCDQKGNMEIQEGLLCYIVERVLSTHKKELAILERDISELTKVKAPFYHIKHKEAAQKMQEMNLAAREDDDFGADEEISFANNYDRPIFVENYPAKVKAFYMKKDPEDVLRVVCADLLVPGIGEIFGGSQREDNYDVLFESIKRHKLPIEAFQWYLDLRKFGSVVHSGFGLGLERVVAWLTGAHHVRETIPFPRVLNRVWP